MDIPIPSGKHVDPRRAIAYARHPGGSPSRGIPFVIWLVIVLGVIMAIRNGQRGGGWKPGADLPGQAVTYAIAGSAIVLVATVAPELVTQILMILVLLAFLTNIPYLTSAFDTVNARIKTLAPAG